jgi:hypothetical protein
VVGGEEGLGPGVGCQVAGVAFQVSGAGGGASMNSEYEL